MMEGRTVRRTRAHRSRITVAAATLFGATAFAALSAASAAPTGGESRTADTRPEFVIASIGDSYAAGEGTMVRNGDFDANGVLRAGGSEEAWGGFTELGASFAGNLRADLCHRSRHAGAAVAARTLQDRYPGIRIVFRSFACSGATIPKGLLGPYVGADDALKPRYPDQLPQIQQLDSFIGGRANKTLDALVLGIGGNDLGFPGIVALCLIPPSRIAVAGAALGAVVPVLLVGPIGLAFAQTTAIVGGITAGALAGCQGWGLEATILDGGVRAVERSYADLARAIRGTRAGPSSVRLRFLPGRVYITEYPDPTHDENGVLCDGSGFHAGELYANITRPEARWVFEQALPRINGAVRDAARAHSWTYVGGVADAFRRHGVCSDGGAWFNDNNGALRHQGADLLPGYPGISVAGARAVTTGLFGRPLSGGVAHPSIRGQQEYGRLISERLEQQLRERFAVTAAPQLSVARFRSTPPSPTDAFKLRLTWTRDGIEAPVVRWQLRDGTAATRLLPISIAQPAGEEPPGYVYTGRGSFSFSLRGCGHIGCGPWSAPVAFSNSQ